MHTSKHMEKRLTKAPPRGGHIASRPPFPLFSQTSEYLEESLRIGKLTRAVRLLEPQDALLVDDEDRAPGAVPLNIVDPVRLASRPVDVAEERVG